MVARSQRVESRGRLMVEGKRGRPAFEYPSGPQQGKPRKTLSVSRQLVVRAVGGGRSVLEAVDLPAELYASAIETAQKAETSIDASLPDLKQVDLTQANPVPRPEGKVDWQVKPEGAPSWCANLERPVIVSPPNSRLSGPDLLGVALSPRLGKAVIGRRDGPEGPNGKTRRFAPML